jgi:hypothetical protein
MDKYDHNTKPDREILSTEYGLVEGVKTIFWQDIKAELEIWLSDIRTMAEDPDGSLSNKSLHRLGGNAESIRRMLLLPDVLLSIKRDELKRREKE